MAKSKKSKKNKKANNNVFTVKAIKIVDELVRNDPYYAERKSIVDLRTGTEARASRYNFFGLIRIMDDSKVHLCEMDLESHISIIDEEYFNANLKGKIDNNRFLDEDAPSFKGITGEWYKSSYKPLRLDFQMGSCKLSGRFIISSTLSSAPVLIGSDIIYKYGLSVVSNADGKWSIKIGYNPLSIADCYISKKIDSDLSSKKL